MRTDVYATLTDNVRSGETEVVVWGMGYIGLTTAIAFLESGARVVGIDIDTSRLDALEGGIVLLNEELDYRADVRDYVRSGQLRLLSDPLHIQLQPVGCHFVCVPTEANGEPDSRPLFTVLSFLADKSPKSLILIESTLSPGWLTDPLFGNLIIGVSPRRDWFHSKEHTTRHLTRVCSANHTELVPVVQGLLEIVSESVVPSNSFLATVATKAFENSIWYLLFSYVGELATHLSLVDFQEVLRLAQTNWRTPFSFEPSFQVGGYCLPLAARYIQDLIPAYRMRTLAAAQEANNAMIDAVLERVCRGKPKSVLILGISYRPGVRIATNSAGRRVAEACTAKGMEVFAHDPLFSSMDVQRLTGAQYCSVPDQLDRAECLVVCVDHEYYRSMNAEGILGRCRRLKRILDCKGTLSHYSDVFRSRSISYLQLFTKGW